MNHLSSDELPQGLTELRTVLEFVRAVNDYEIRGLADAAVSLYTARGDMLED